jgi:dipeptidyl aminopeptidase/acylaminoacyl peptidase
MTSPSNQLPQAAPYGTWRSPITADLIVAGSIGLGGLALEGADLYWSESRPTEGGRTVILRAGVTAPAEINPAPMNARSRVHEYGGGSYRPIGTTVYFTNDADQRLYRAERDAAPVAITPEITPERAYRYAEVIADSHRHRLICVREDHSLAGQEAVNTIVALPDSPDLPQTVLTGGHDFFASPQISPDGQHLTWITWDHPNMPWDGTELWIAPFNPDGSLGAPTRLAGSRTESIFQPQWGPDGKLYFVADRTGWWNLYRIAEPASAPDKIEAICPMDAEFGLPQWVFGMSTYGFATGRSGAALICTYLQNGLGYLASLDLISLKLTPIPTPYSSIVGLQVNDHCAAFLGGSVSAPTAVVRLDLQTQAITVLRRATELQIDPGYLAKPQPIEFPTAEGLSAFGFYYPPTNQDFAAPASERPPLVVKSHGGPTAATSAEFNLRIQYWTSRGFGLLDVNYGGSTGYGRAYRQRLNGQWGVVDVADCANGAKYLVGQGLVDADRLVIAGGSAGGYTTLCALTFDDTFKAGASYYGVSDLKVLAEDTHKFESRYLDSLIGPYPDRADLYEARSPINFTDRLNCPVIFFQGDEDKIVPPNQAELMVQALRLKGLPVAYVLYAGEQHGFRKAENIKRTLDGEFYFYSRVFGFEPAEAIEPLMIDNL